MPEYSSTTITPADGVQVPSMNGSTAGNILLSALKSYMLSGAGQANGLATLGSDGKLTAAQLPDLADDVIVVSTYANLPSPGTAAKIYITADTNKGYRWDPELTTPDYVKIFELDKSIVFGYYSSGSFYEDSEHTVQITPVFYVDVSLADIYVLNDGTLIELLGTKWAKITDIQDGTIQAGVATKAWQDILGRAIITTYETKADASDLKSAIRKDEARITNLEEKADPTGAYKTVNYRGTNAVPTGKAKYGLVESIVGKSRAWNTIVKDGNFSNGTSNWDKITSSSYEEISATDNELTVSIVSTSAANGISQVNNIISGHCYVVQAEFYPSVSTTVKLSSQNWINQTIPANVWTTVCKIQVAGENQSRFHIYVDNSGILGAGATVKIRKVVLRDLTPIFPELTSAEIQSLGIAGLLAICPDLLKYDAFGTSIVDTTVEGVKSVGVNIWDGEKEVGNINGVSGQDTPNNDVYRSVGYIKVEPNTDYYFYNSTAGNTAGALFFYDYNKNYITLANNSRNTKVTTPPNCFYIRMAILIANFGTGVQICLDSASDKTTYHPYMTDTLTLPSPVTLRSAGTVAEEFDLETGEKSNPLGEYTFTGSESWAIENGYAYNTANVLPVSGKPSSNNCICVVGQCGITSNSGGKRVVFYLDTTTYDTVAKVQALTYGKTILYELATPDDPTQLTPVIDNTIATEGGGTINTIQDNVYPDESPAPTIDNSMDVGYLAL